MYHIRKSDFRTRFFSFMQNRLFRFVLILNQEQLRISVQKPRNCKIFLWVLLIKVLHREKVCKQNHPQNFYFSYSYHVLQLFCNRNVTTFVPLNSLRRVLSKIMRKQMNFIHSYILFRNIEFQNRILSYLFFFSVSAKIFV